MLLHFHISALQRTDPWTHTHRMTTSLKKINTHLNGKNKTRICHGVTAEVSRERRNFNPSQSWRNYNCFIRQCHDRLKWYRRLAGTSVFVCPASTEQQHHHHHHHSDDRQQEEEAPSVPGQWCNWWRKYNDALRKLHCRSDHLTRASTNYTLSQGALCIEYVLKYLNVMFNLPDLNYTTVSFSPRIWLAERRFKSTN